MSQNKTQKTTLLSFIFIIYMIALITLILLKYGLQTGLGSLNLTPFRWFLYPQDIVFRNVVGNMNAFVPFGLLLPLRFRKLNAVKTVFAGALLSLIFEIIQYVTDTGAADIDDIILNTTGVIIGALLFTLLKKSIRGEEKLQRIGFIVVVVFGVLSTAIFLFA